jgi:hypothetical protein
MGIADGNEVRRFLFVCNELGGEMLRGHPVEGVDFLRTNIAQH